MGGPRISRDERNQELEALNGTEGRHGRLRVRLKTAMYWNAKDKVEFECLDCESGSEGGWKMQIHNVLWGKGCPRCKSISSVVSTFISRFPEHQLVPLASKSGPPDINSIRYEIRPLEWLLPEDFGWKLPSLAQITVKRSLANNRLPGEEALLAYERFVEATKVFYAAFPNGGIRYSGKSKQNSTSPGPFYSVDTGARALRRPFSVNAITIEGILKHCRQEKKDKELKELLEEQAKEHGAKIIGYEHPEYGNFQVRYLSRTGFAGCDTIWRAREKFWGQSGYRQGETLALVVLSELFPTDDWLRNTRPQFLLKDNGYKLELDGYSPSLKLALEYQGSHHYKPRSQASKDAENHKKVIAHDKLKSKLCKKANVRLVVVAESKPDPEAFLSHVSLVLAAIQITPTNPSPSLDEIKRRWNEICANPLAPFQALLKERLGAHKLIDPELSAVCKTTVIRYECGNCHSENEARANGFTGGEPRRYCPKCKGLAAGAGRRAATLDQWESEGLPRSFLDVLQPNEGTERTNYIYVCKQKHRTLIHGATHAKRHMVSGTFNCPSCVSEETGIAASQVANLNRYRERLKDDLKTLGLNVVKDLPYDDEGEMAAEAECEGGHRFITNKRRVALMLKNECLNDKNVVPTACPDCCYPGLQEEEFWLLRSTVFHRLYVLGEMYPKIQYISGFDPKSFKTEFYSCGETHADGTPHPPIRISFRNIQKSAKRNPKVHLCAACGLETGQVVGGGKTLADLAALMKVMREEIERRKKLPGDLSSPTVEFISGPLSDKGEVSTTKTLLRFWCGVREHEPVEATKDYYFNRAEIRGRGFCSQCVQFLGEKKAPLPACKAKGGSLRLYKLRDHD